MLSLMRTIRSRFPLILAALAVLVLIPAVAVGAGINEEIYRQVFQRAAGDNDVAAKVDGEIVTRGAVRQAATTLRAQQPNLSEADTRKSGFRLIARNVATEIEASRRGIRVTREEAERFASEQRENYRRADSAVKLPVTEAIKNSGLSENEYWKRQVDVYIRTLAVAKLRERVMAELPPTASQQERVKHYEEFQEALVSKAKIEYIDKTLQ